MINKEQLYRECRFVRDVAKEIHYDKNNGLSYMRNGEFPKGWCGALASVLCVWLERRFPGEDFYYVCGYAGRQTHAWVKYKNLIIDITADQFNGCSDEVIIVEERNSPLHKRFRVEGKPIKKSIYDMCYSPEKNVYNMLIQRSSEN